MADPFVRSPHDRFFKHGHKRGYKGTRIYLTWRGMIQRCTNPKDAAFAYYGGRGIRVCDRWKKSLQDFVSDVGFPPTPKHELDRIDKDGDYAPGNCRWATHKENMRNARHNHLITFRGKTQCRAAWAEELGIPPNRIRDRLYKLGWSIERALTEPPEIHIRR
jgi:hypothetical protein